MNLDTIRYIPARWQGVSGFSPTLIVLHDMEAGEFSTTAENCANYFKNMTDPRKKASCGYNCDNDSTVCSVKPGTEAYHAGYGEINRCSVGIEQAGFASQTVGEWTDAYGVSMITNQVAPLVKALCDRYGIQVVFLTAADLRAGKRNGITTHWEVTKAFVPGGHTDPGPNYPINWLLTLVRGEAPTSSSGGNKMIDFATNTDGRAEEFRIINGKVHVKWQGSPNGGWSGYLSLQPIGDDPGSFDNVAAFKNADGRLEVVAFHSAYGVPFRKSQKTAGGGWGTWAKA